MLGKFALLTEVSIAEITLVGARLCVDVLMLYEVLQEGEFWWTVLAFESFFDVVLMIVSLEWIFVVECFVTPKDVAFEYPCLLWLSHHLSTLNSYLRCPFLGWMWVMVFSIAVFFIAKILLMLKILHLWLVWRPHVYIHKGLVTEFQRLGSLIWHKGEVTHRST